MGIPAPIGVAASGLPPLRDQANAVVRGSATAIGPTAPFAFRGPMNMAVWGSIIAELTTTAASLAATVDDATGLAVGNAISSPNVPRGATIGALSGTDVTLALPPVTYMASNLSVATANITLPPGSNVAQLVGAAVSVPSPDKEGLTIPAGTTVSAVVQADIAPTNDSPGRPGIITLSAAPTVVPAQVPPQPIQFAPIGAAIVTTGADAAAEFTGYLINYTGTLLIERSYDGGLTWLLCNIGGGGAPARYTSGVPLSLTFGEPEKEVLYRLNFTAVTGTINYRISETGEAATSLSIPSPI